MKYYESLLDMGCFTRQEVCALTGGEAAAHSILYEYCKKGLIERVRRDLYVAVSLESKQPVRSRYAIASKITADSYITHHSAFEYYGCANQVYYEIYVGGERYFPEFEYDGVRYRYVKPHISAGIAEKSGVRVTDTERTVLDGIKDFEKIGGAEELLYCIEALPSVNEERLLKYLRLYGSKGLYQRAGYILEHFNRFFQLSEGFFSECRGNLPESKRYLYKSADTREWEPVARWNLYAPREFFSLTDKGVPKELYL